MKNQLIIISLFLSIAYCKADTKNLCDLGNDTFSRNVFIIANAKMTTPYCSFFLDFGSPGISVKNIRDKGVVHSGFIVGTATDNQEISTVEIQIDSGTYAKPQVVSSRFVYTGNSQYHLVDWSFKLPTGTNSWKDGSSHTLNFRSRDTAGNYSVLTSLSVRKGENKDINGDGFSDSVVSANTIDTIYIFHGSTNGIAATAYNSGVTKTLVGAGGSAYGWGVGLGDVNGDGFADLIVGANAGVGIAYIYHGSINGITATSYSGANTVINGPGGTNFGSTLSVGDVNGDGYGDLAVTSLGSSDTYIYNGSSSGVSNNPSTSIIGIGSFAVLGDINSDGFADLFIGDTAANTVYIFHGKSTGISATSSAGATKSITGPASAFGISIAVGNANGDGFLDVAIGASTTGFAYIFHGSSTGITGTSFNSGVNTSIVGNASFGTSIALDDLNADGYADLAVGEQTSNFTYIFPGSGSGVTATAFNAGVKTTIAGNAGTSFGRQVAISDLNGDGIMDLTVGASAGTGSVYYFHGSTNGITATAFNSGVNSTVAGNGGSFGFLLAQ